MNKGKIKMFLIFLLVFLCIGIIFSMVLNLNMISKTKEKIITADEAADIQGADCILVLGCGIRDDGSPSNMLEDRLLTAIELYEKGIAKKIIMSGDDSGDSYNEVAVMKDYAVKCGVPSEDIFLDHAGFSTYESMYRAKEVFGAEKIIIVTQEYHLYRALYLADCFSIEAYGVDAAKNTYPWQIVREFREILARVKDTFTGIYKPDIAVSGEMISLHSSGDDT